MVDILSWGLIIFLAAQRLWELNRSARNIRALKAMGAKEYGAGHYPFMVLFHVVFFVIMFCFLAMGARMSIKSAPWLVIFVLAQFLRFWSIRSLGERWSTRVLILPGKPLVSAGPYRFLRHPIYIGVFLEILSIPMAYDLSRTAVFLAFCNSAILWIRVREENNALKQVSGKQK